MTNVTFFYWCNVKETWVQCTEHEYHTQHYGKSFTKQVWA